MAGLLDALKDKAAGYYADRKNALTKALGSLQNAPAELRQMIEPRWQAEMRKPENKARFDQNTKDLGFEMAMTFAGPLAKTADIGALKVAEALKAKGIPDEQIYKQTGWFFGMPDGKPRFEIPDDAAELSVAAKERFTPGMIQTFGRKHQASVPSTIEHPQLVNAYPEWMRDIEIRESPKLEGASFYSREHAFDPNRLVGIIEMSQSGGNPKSTILHELQHAIQQREGFARGGSPEAMREEALQMLRRDVASGEIPSTEQAMAMLPMAQQNAYRRLAGEAEARLTQSRMNMTAAERAASYPPSMFDVPVDQQIVRFK